MKHNNIRSHYYFSLVYYLLDYSNIIETNGFRGMHDAECNGVGFLKTIGSLGLRGFVVTIPSANTHVSAAKVAPMVLSDGQ